MGRRLHELLDKGLKLMFEQDDAAAAAAGQAAALGAANAPPGAAPTGAQPGQAAPSGAAVGADGQALTVDTIVDRLNVIRGGKSFDDPEAYGQLTTLFNGLPDAEKTILDKVLSGIGQIVAVIPGQEQGAVNPKAMQPAMQQQGGAPPAAGAAPASPTGAPPIAAV